MKYLLYGILVIPVITNAATVSWYGPGFHGKRTANGEVFNQNALTCASNSHKMGTKLLVTNPATNKSVVVKVNDTGGFKKYGRTLDLSKAAFHRIAPLNQALLGSLIQDKQSLIQVGAMDVKRVVEPDRSVKEVPKEQVIQWVKDRHPEILEWLPKTKKQEHICDAIVAIYAGMQTLKFKDIIQ